MAAQSTSEDMETKPLEAIVDQAINASEGDCVTLREVVKSWDDRSFGPLFIILGLVGGTPLAVVPGAAAVVGVLIALIALQFLVGRKYPWLPGWALDREVSQSKLRKIAENLRPSLAFLDNLITERFTLMTGKVMRRLAAAVVALLGLVMIPFDAIPFAVAAPAWAVVIFGVAITARDGVVMTAALAVAFGIGLLAFGLIG